MAVLYPLSLRIFASGATLLGSTDVTPGNGVAISESAPMFALWELRPVSSATRLGEHAGVTRKLL